MTADVVAWLDDLNEEEAWGISVWLNKIKTQRDLQYNIIPAIEVIDSIARGTIHRSFSCAGFVACAYAEGAGVRLVVDEAELPAASVELLERIWGPIVRRRARVRYGLDGDGPWRVLLPGYVLAALAGGRAALPWRPSLGDADVPPGRGRGE